jgi:hypothetical protein
MSGTERQVRGRLQTLSKWVGEVQCEGYQLRIGAVPVFGPDAESVVIARDARSQTFFPASIDVTAETATVIVDIRTKIAANGRPAIGRLVIAAKDDVDLAASDMPRALPWGDVLQRIVENVAWRLVEREDGRVDLEQQFTVAGAAAELRRKRKPVAQKIDEEVRRTADAYRAAKRDGVPHVEYVMRAVGLPSIRTTNRRITAAREAGLLSWQE